MLASEKDVFTPNMKCKKNLEAGFIQTDPLMQILSHRKSSRQYRVLLQRDCMSIPMLYAHTPAVLIVTS